MNEEKDNGYISWWGVIELYLIAQGLIYQMILLTKYLNS